MRRSVSLVVATTMSLGLVAQLASCTTFGSESGTADAGPDREADAALSEADAAIVEAGGDGGCTGRLKRFDLDFESTVFPPADFAEFATPGAATVARSPAAGRDGSAGLVSSLQPYDAAAGPTAIIRTRVDAVTALTLAYDFTAPAQTPLFAQVGCRLAFNPDAAAGGTSADVYIAVAGGSGPALQTVSRPSGAAIKTKELEPATSAFHHLLLNAAAVPTGGWIVSYEMGPSKDSFQLELSGPIKAVDLICGLYADSFSVPVSAVIDNVHFEACVP